MLALRTAPLKNGGSPASKLINRELRTNLPSLSYITQPMLPTYSKTKLNYDRNAKDLPKLNVNDSVRFQERDAWSRKGKIVKLDDNPRSYHLITDKNTIIRRNRSQLLPTKEEVHVLPDEIIETNSLVNLPVDSPSLDTNDINESNGDDEIISNDLHDGLSTEHISNKEVVDVETKVTRSGRFIKKPLRYR